MAIREFSPEGTPRAKIAFVGEVPSSGDLQRFVERKITWDPADANQPVTLDQLRDPDYIAKLDAVIWTQDRDNLKTFALVEAAYRSAASSGSPVCPDAI